MKARHFIFWHRMSFLAVYGIGGFVGACLPASLPWWVALVIGVPVGVVSIYLSEAIFTVKVEADE